MTLTNLIKFDPHKKKIILQGAWDLQHLSRLKKDMATVTLPAQGELIIDGDSIKQMDTAGAWLLGQWINQLTEQGLQVEAKNFSNQHQILLTLLQKQTKKKFKITKIKLPNWLARVGMYSIGEVREINIFLSFIGLLAIEAIAIIFHPSRIRWREIAGIIYKSGYQALPIIALMSFMVGVVLAYQTGTELQKYGASIFIVELLGYAVFREFAPLITAIMVAGRTGSAFTAQLGIMKINQEIDVLNTMSVQPGELLILPRIIALVIVLPLLIVWANIFGIFGGMLITANLLHISWYEFLHRFQLEVPLRELAVGLIKAPVFALIIASVGCFQGMRVENTADSLGRLTTRSVVLAIFFIIVADAIFSVLFNAFGLK